MKNKRYILFFFVYLLFACTNLQTGFYKSLSEERPIFYQIIIDRFFDGDKTNNYRVDISNPYGFHGGDLRGIYDKIGYLSDLGVNAVILSPVIDNVDGFVEYEGYKHYGYHGYWPENFEKIEEHFGDFVILSRLSSELHRLRIAYIQDIVLNHAGYKSIWEKNGLWVRSVRFGGCIDNDDLRQCLFGLPDFKTERKDVRRFLINSYKALMKKVNFDGVRIDAMKHFDSILLNEIRDEFNDIKPDTIFIGEYWGSSANEMWLSLFLRYRIDYLFDFEFRDYVSGFLRGSMRPEVFVSYLNKRYEIAEKGFIVFLNNHDLDGIITHFDLKDQEEEGKILKIMAILQFVGGGSPLIYYGEENGLKVGKGIDNRRDMQFGECIKGIRSLYKDLISMKKRGILSGKFLAEYEEGLLLIRLENSSGEIITIINPDRDEKRLRIYNKDFKIIGLGYLILRIKENIIEPLLLH